MDSFGERLRRTREQRGVSLADIAASTKIAVAALEALERNDVRRLPGGIFGRAMVRSYAVAIGLDGDATVSDFVAEIARAERDHARAVRQPEITADDRQFLARQRRAYRVLRVVTVLVIIAIVLVTVWFVWGRRNDTALNGGRAGSPTLARRHRAVPASIRRASAPAHPCIPPHARGRPAPYA